MLLLRSAAGDILWGDDDAAGWIRHADGLSAEQLQGSAGGVHGSGVLLLHRHRGGPNSRFVQLQSKNISNIYFKVMTYILCLGKIGPFVFYYITEWFFTIVDLTLICWLFFLILATFENSLTYNKYWSLWWSLWSYQTSFLQCLTKVFTAI